MESAETKLLKIEVQGVQLEGELAVPSNCQALVIFSHGSGSSRFSPRNNFVAQQLQRRGIATFLVDLLTKREDEFYEVRFNIDLLTERLILITRWLSKVPELDFVPVGYFGASTGAASALSAAALIPHRIQAVVSRGGRPDLAMNKLTLVEAPTLLIVGEYDVEVVMLNRKAYDKLNCTKQLEVVTHATHLFEEHGALEKVSELAGDWFTKYLVKETTGSTNPMIPVSV